MSENRIKPPSQVQVTCRVSPIVKDELEKEMQAKGFKSLNTYLPYIIQNRNASTLPPPPTSTTTTANEVKLKKELEQLKQENESLKKLVDTTAGKKLKHVINRAWEISRITETKLLEGYDPNHG